MICEPLSINAKVPIPFISTVDSLLFPISLDKISIFLGLVWRLFPVCPSTETPKCLNFSFYLCSVWLTDPAAYFVVNSFAVDFLVDFLDSGFLVVGLFVVGCLVVGFFVGIAGTVLVRDLFVC